jgi:hypothetical protein
MAMIEIMKNVPSNMIGFCASGIIQHEDFTSTVLPVIEKLIENQGTLNYMLVLDPSIKNNCVDDWWEEALLSIKNLREWHRVAVVSNSEEIKDFTDLFNLVSAGEFHGFVHSDLQQAIDWVSGKKHRTL